MMDQLRPFRDEVEVIFSDGGSTDDTLSLIGDEFKVVSCKKGRGKQLNDGALASCGDVLFFLHCLFVFILGEWGKSRTFVAERK
jgi:glycosyltransferase involved in cell wall biosynthesis